MTKYNEHLKTVGGWLTRDESRFLYERAKKVPQGQCIVEIGSWKGRSTISLAKGSSDGNKVKVYAIDPHMGSVEHVRRFIKVNTYQTFLQNIRNHSVEEHVIPIVSTSVSASKVFREQIGLLFIDGAHDYNSVREDYVSWFSKVADNGVIAIHDSWHLQCYGPGILSALELIVSDQISRPGLVGTITFFQKVGSSTKKTRFANIVFLLYRTIFGIFGYMKLKRNGSLRI